MPAWQCDDVAVTAADIDAGTKQRITGSRAGIDGGACRAVESDLVPAAAGQDTPCRREFMIALEHGKRSITTMPRIDIDNDQPISANAKISRRLVSEPFADRGLIGRSG